MKPDAVQQSDVPTMTESGYPEIGTGNWQGLFAARGTPPAIIQKLHAAVVQAMNSPSARAEIAKVNATVETSETPETLATEITSEMAKWEKLKPDVMGLPKEN